MTDAVPKIASAPPIMADQVQILKEIRDSIVKMEHNQASSGFNAGTATALAIAGAFSFILALALNQFFQLLFAKIPVGSGLLGAAIYAIKTSLKPNDVFVFFFK